MRPIDHATDFTLEFVLRHARPGQRLLEIGCGRGDLAVALTRAGLTVVAIDVDPSAVSCASSLGADARTCDLLDFDAPPFDAVLFSRSLHHIADLHVAVERARSLTLAGGLLLIEDFDLLAPDNDTAEWYFSNRPGPDADRHRTPAPPTAADPPRMRWLREHEHSGAPALHAAGAMHEAVSTRFGRPTVETCPYLFRSWVSPAPDDELGARRVAAALATERFLIESGSIRPVGWRCVASAR